MQEIALQESKDICGGGIGWVSVLCPLEYLICAVRSKNPDPSKWC
jgi:hypothetical protein